MIKILFVCLGNICRSPMAEFVMKDMVRRRGLEGKIEVASAATSRSEEGSPVHYGTRNRLAKEGISVAGKTARQITPLDYHSYDMILGMEARNVDVILRITGEDKDNKVARLLDYTDHPRDIADPWYTGDFDATYNDIAEGCEALLEYIEENLL